MNSGMLLERAAEAMADRVAFGSRCDGLTYAGRLARPDGSPPW